MAIVGWYYLHTNGDLIFQHETGETVADLRESDFARMLWPCDPEDREGAWRILIEAASLGARPDRIAELADKWCCDDEDAAVFADRVGVKLDHDGDAWTAANAKNNRLPPGRGTTALAAMADLCRLSGYRPAKMWGMTFAQFLAAAAASGEDRSVNYSLDGNQVCATRPTFTNLQESHAGFGDTKAEVLAELLEDERSTA